MDLISLMPLTRLRILRLAGGRKLASLDGIEAFSALEELRLLDLRALSDIEALSGVADSLWSLDFNTCRRITRLNALASLRRLTRLLVINCGEIESLGPIAQLPLKVLHFYESTNIRDGRLDVLRDLPDLTDTSFANRRHYSHTRDEIQSAISGRA
jgi:internalin A